MTQSSTREKIIRIGAGLVHAQGFSATGIQQVLHAAGIPKGSFYYYFKSKEDFGLAVIDHFTSISGQIFSLYLGDRSTPPLKRLENLFEHYEKLFEKTGCTRGCPVGNLSLELAGNNEMLRARLNAAIQYLITRIKSCLQEAKQDHFISAGLDTDDASSFIFHAFEGAILQMKVEKSIEPYKTFRRYTAEYLKK